MKRKIKLPSKTKRFSVKKEFSVVASSMGMIFFLIFGIIIFLTPSPMFSAAGKKEKSEQELKISQQEDNLILEKATDYYNRGMYLKAIDEINIAIEFHQRTQDLSDNIQLMAESSYYAWIKSLYKNSAGVSKRNYDKMVLYITLHPEIVSPRIISLVDRIYEQKKLEGEQEKLSCIEKENRKQLEKVLQKIYRLEQSKKSMDDVISGNKTVSDIRREIEIESDYQKARNIKILMISLYILIILSILLLIVHLHQKHKRMLLAQEQFETTMKVVSILQLDAEDDKTPYMSLRNSDSETEAAKIKIRKKTGLSDFDSKNIAASYFEKPESKKQFLALQHQCIELGEKIDRITGRKKNSKKVSELVFKLSKAAGVDDELALIYYCAAMVYDAGFLSVSKNILQGEHLTIRERYEVRSHVQKAGEYFGFIPEDVRTIFLDASEFHHENIDGKGYLAGLSGSKIPLIARFIRVAESYISLINPRSYRKIMDAEAAFNEMKKKNGIYDSKILALLEKVI